MDPVITALLTKSLDGLAARYSATAQNIANVNSSAYRPVRVSFEGELAAALKGGAAAILATPIRIEQLPQGSGGSAVRLDLELADATRTSMRYGALVDLLGRQLQLQHLIARGGQ